MNKRLSRYDVHRGSWWEFFRTHDPTPQIGRIEGKGFPVADERWHFNMSGADGKSLGNVAIGNLIRKVSQPSALSAEAMELLK